MKKIICLFFALLLLTATCFAANENVTIDFPIIMSEDPADFPENIVVDNGFHNGIWLGKLSTTCTLGNAVTFKFEKLSLEDYGAVSFGLTSQYVDEDSTLEIAFVDENGEKYTESIALKTTNPEMYIVKMPEGKTIVGFEIFINSLPDDNSMFDVEIEFVKFHKGNSVMLLSTKEALAIHDNEKIVPQSPAVIRDGSTLTPARFVAERFGAKVEWIASERKVVITKDETVIELVIDSKTALVNGKEVELASPACIIDNYTYTPARFVAESLGCTVDWDAQTKTVFIDYVQPEAILPLTEPIRVVFSSNAGNWSSNINLFPDGTFEGYYADYNYGESGEGYNGTKHFCSWNGKFDNVKKIDDYTYSLTLMDVTIENMPGEFWIDEDKQKCLATEPAGFDYTIGKEYILILPQKDLSEIPETIVVWWKYLFHEESKETFDKIDCYCFYRPEKTDHRFFGSEITYKSYMNLKK